MRKLVVALVAAVTCLLVPRPAAPVRAETSPPAVGRGVSFGEPYELMGKRLVFTNWFFVRPGNFAWLDDQGNGVTVTGSQGPWGAHFKRQDFPHGLRLVVQPAERVGPLTKSEFPWESKGIAITTVIQEDGKYRGWGTCLGEKGSSFCYLESADGMTWTRPELGITRIDGQDTNLLEGPERTVFVDPAGPPGERYKGVTLNEMSFDDFEAWKKRRPDGWEPRAKREDVKHAYYIQGSVSPDGLHWRTLPEPLVIEHSDTQIVAYYDQRLRKYVIYTRNWMVGQQAPASQPWPSRDWWGVGRRSIGRTESSDFLRFPPSELILVPPLDLLPSDVLYTNCRTSIPGAPDHHLMFPTVWHTSDDSTSVIAASSHDGKAWSFVPGGAVAGTAAFGRWDGGCVFARPNLIELPDGSFALPYTGYDVPHKYPRGRFRFQTGYFVWPKGRIIALEAPELGEFATVALVPPGRKLRINAVTTRAGGIQVEVAGLDGKALPGRSFRDADSVQGDAYRQPVTWKKQDDLGFQPGQAIMLRFRMDRARIFGLEFQ